MAYIKKKPIVEFITKGLNNPDKDKAFGHDAIEILAEIEYAPTADVEEVRHGEWTVCSDLPKPKIEIRQVVARTSYDGDGFALEGTIFLNELLKAGAHVVSVVPYYDRKGRIAGNEYLLEVEKEINNDPCRA